jgi:hypothetical protein
MGAASAGGVLREINIVLYWFEELKQRAPPAANTR